MVDEEARREVAGDDPGARLDSAQLPAAPAETDASTRSTSSPHGRRTAALDIADHRAGDQDLVDHLGVLARHPGRPGGRSSCPSLRSRGAPRRTLSAPADHDRQRRVPGSDVAAGHRCVERVTPPPSAASAISTQATARWSSCRRAPCPAWRVDSAPSAPSSTSRTSVGKPTIENTMSLAAATSGRRVGPRGARRRAGLRPVPAAVVTVVVVALASAGVRTSTHP